MTKAEQREMDNLRRRVAELTEALAKATVGDGLPWFNAHVHDPRARLGFEMAPTPHRSVRFYESAAAAKDGRRFFDVRLGVVGSLKPEPGPQLLVMTEAQLVILPHASNVVAIQMLPLPTKAQESPSDERDGRGSPEGARSTQNITPGKST